jgi:hypothetical protein
MMYIYLTINCGHYHGVLSIMRMERDIRRMDWDIMRMALEEDAYGKSTSIGLVYLQGTKVEPAQKSTLVLQLKLIETR